MRKEKEGVDKERDEIIPVLKKSFTITKKNMSFAIF